jgi:hypothetical protein
MQAFHSASPLSTQKQPYLTAASTTGIIHGNT